MRTILAVPYTAAFTAAFFMAAPAGAAPVICSDRATVAAQLEKTYSEIPVSMGLATNGAVIEIFASPSGSFTIIVTRPDGVSCIMAAGEVWENLPKRLAGTKIRDQGSGIGGRFVIPDTWHLTSEDTDPSTWRPGASAGFFASCGALPDIFRLAALYDGDPTNHAANAYLDDRGNSCRRTPVLRFGVLRQRISARYVIDDDRGRAHVWRVDVDDGAITFVVIGEGPPPRREA